MIKITGNPCGLGMYNVYDVTSFRFPVGELQTKISSTGPWDSKLNFEYVFDGSDSVLELLFAVDAAKRNGLDIGYLKMSYVPFSRQDRVINKGESFTLKVFCDLINGLNFEKVYIDDPHSDVTPALLNNCVVRTQDSIFTPIITENFVDDSYYLVSPDGGALKKIYRLAERVKSKGVIECSKKRNVTNGKITGTVVNLGPEHDFAATHIIQDDLLDAGATFIHLAKELKSKGVTGKIVLMVTHGFFTKGLSVFDGMIDEIYTKCGRVK